MNGGGPADAVRSASSAHCTRHYYYNICYLTRSKYTDSFTDAPHLTFRTTRGERRAYVSSEDNQRVIHADPYVLGQDRAKGHLGGLRCRGTDNPKAVHDPMYMGVDADGGNGEGVRENQVGGLAADAWQSKEFLHG